MVMESGKDVGNWKSFDFVLFRGEIDFFGLFRSNDYRKGLYKILFSEG
jgi:hypothetical protein